jgi:hypothetical protein
MPAHSFPRIAPLLSVLALATALAPAGRATQPGETPYSTALHMHGSFSEGVGSQEYASWKAQQTGVADVIWWTDHDWRVEHWNHTNAYDFENATVDTGTFRVKEPDTAYLGEWRYWEVADATAGSWSVSIVTVPVFQGAKSLRMSVAKTAAGSAFEGLGLVQTSSRKHNRWSLATRPKLSFSVFPVSVNSFSRFYVDVRLSDHAGIAHSLRYVMGALSGEPASTIPLPHTNGQWNTYELDLVADAQNLFTAGGADTLRAEDNVLFEVTIGVATRHSSTVPTVFFDDYRILPDSSAGLPQMIARNRDFAALYETMYPPTRQFVGTEISRFRAQPHLNGFTPGTYLVSYAGKSFADSIYWAVDQVHAQCGAVSLNHIFGTGVTGDTTETPQQRQGRIDFRKREMIAARVYDCDLFEVGYRLRQGVDLAGFLETWDAITGNAIFVTANGVTDSHGADFLDGWGPWQPGVETDENNFVTWLYAEQLDEAGLIHAMKAGRAYFGDPFVFDPDGTVDLVTGDGFPMGRVVLTDKTTHDLVVEVVGMPPTAQVRLLQGEIRESPPTEYIYVNYLRDELLAGTWNGNAWTDTVTVDATVPSFLRVEVEDQGTATAYSNPVHFVRQVPAAGVPAPRVAATLGPVRVTAAEELTLTDATYSGTSIATLVIHADELTPGLGLLEIDCGLLGQPSSVTGGGATSSQFQNGVLTLVGLTGAGSVVTLQWSGAPTGVVAPDGRIDRLALKTGIPNPFGQGTVTELALPRPASVFLEVLDVTGRRVRLLVDERREAGVHRVAWDGRDSLGRPVANGVYFFRLTAAGEVLTAKAVRLR